MKTRVAIITGAAGKGIGRSTALTLAREGARVVVNYRTSAGSATSVVDHIRASGGDAIACQADVTQAEDCERLIKQTVEHYGTVDILVVGPGAGWHPAALGKLSGADALADGVAELAPFCHLLPQVVPIMKANGFGRIIGIGVNLAKPSPSFAYNAAKAARAGYFEQGWSSLWDFGITMNLVCPGPVGEIGSLEEAIALSGRTSAWHERASVSPQDVAEIIAFLASSSGAFVTGAQIPLMFK